MISEQVTVAQRRHIQQLETVVNLGRRIVSNEDIFQRGLGIRRVWGNAARIVSNCSNHFQRQGTEIMAVAKLAV